MKRYLILIILAVYILSCRQHIENKNSHNQNSENGVKGIEQVVIEDIIIDSTLNVRALEIDSAKGAAAFASSDGRIGLILEDIPKTENVDHSTLGVFYLGENKIEFTKENFRSLALTNQGLYVLNIGSPAHLYKINKNDSITLVYEETAEKAFYDSMEFWDEKEGIAIGDPTENCISILITDDGGENWNKITCDSLPLSRDGEAAFAASDTNIKTLKNKVWVATGGKASRVYYSGNRGKDWEVFETPIIQGSETTGIYSIDFYDENNGFAVGGDYTIPESNVSNKMRTKDGGRTWKIVSDSLGPGYRSSVQYVPNGDAKSLVVIGKEGIDYSNDEGDSWKHLSDERFYTLRFVNDSIAFAAGNGRISRLIFR